jgi:hypothetical protein
MHKDGSKTRRQLIRSVAAKMRPYAFDRRFWAVNGRRIPGQPLARKIAILEAEKAVAAIESMGGCVPSAGSA